MLSAPVRDTRFRLSESMARTLQSTYGTPLYVIDEEHFRRRIAEYRGAAQGIDASTEISFASKANSTLAILALAYRSGCQIDVASEGEFRAALRAGVPASACHFHGSNKQKGELEMALATGVGNVVIDHFGEIEILAALDRGDTQFVLRLAPGVDPVTHEKISTGQADTKFGFNIADGSAERATRRCLEAGLNLRGFHCHVGSQLLDPDAQKSGGELIAGFAVEMKEQLGYAARYLNIGGGLGVVYTAGDVPLSVLDYNSVVLPPVRQILNDAGIDAVLGQEPGRSLIAESGVTLYQVGVVKTVPAKDIGNRTYVGVDGGLSDNPRPAMYGSRYTVEYVGDARGPQRQVTVSGKHCETDKLFDDISLPASVQPGDLLQVLATGAYNASLASNYNRYPRPATVLIRQNGEHCLIQRRETWDEMLAREILPEDLL